MTVKDCESNNSTKYCGRITPPPLNYQRDYFHNGYNIDAMLSVKIDTPTWRHAEFNKEENEKGLICVVDLIDQTRDVADIKEFTTKQRET